MDECNWADLTTEQEAALRAIIVSMIAPDVEFEATGADPVFAFDITFQRAQAVRLVSTGDFVSNEYWWLAAWPQINNREEIVTLTVNNLGGFLSGANVTFAAEYEALTSVSFPQLSAMPGDTVLDFSNAPTLETVDISALRTVSSLALNTLPEFTTLDCGVLTQVGAQLAFVTLPLVTALDLSALVRAGADAGVEFNDLALLESIDFSLVEVCGDVLIEECPELTAFTLPQIKRLGGLEFAGDVGSLVTVTLGAGLLLVNNEIDLAAAPLNQASVDNVLVRLAALDGTGGTTSYDNHTIDLSGSCAIPSATGLTAKGVLEGRGNTVTVNS